jgi:hypothetical protein
VNALTLQPPELVDDQPQHFTGGLGARVRFGFEIPGVLQRVHVCLGAVGQPPLCPQDLMQAVAALAAQDADGQVHGHVIRMFPRNPDVTDPYFGLHGIGLVDDDDPPRRIGRRDEQLRRQIPFFPVTKNLLRRIERFVGGDVADDCQDRAVGDEMTVVKRDEIVAGDAGDGLRRAGLGQAVGMKAIHESIEHRIGDVLRIIKTHTQARQHLLALAIDLRLREPGMSRHVRQHPHGGFEAVLHDDHMQERQVGAGAGAHGAADEVDRVRQFLCRPGRRPLIEQRGFEVCQTELVFWIGGRAGADEQPEIDERLFVVQHRNDLQSVRERPHFVRRKLDVARRQRTRRALGRPVARLCTRRLDTEQQREHRDKYAVADPSQCARKRLHRAPALPDDGMIVSTRRFSDLKYVRATRWTSAVVMP